MIHPIAAASFLALCLPTLSAAQGQELGFEETFALAEDRAAALEQLIPGTGDYYYYSCLYLQHEGQLDQVPEMLRTWIKRHGESTRVQEIRNRQALLQYSSDPAGSIEYLTREMRLGFDHTRRKAGDEVVLPNTLDPSRIARTVWEDNARRRHSNSLKGFGDRRLEDLAAEQLSDQELFELLDRLTRPDVPGLPDLVVRHLKANASRRFGSVDIHKALLLPQLEACVQRLPRLLNDSAFVGIYLTKLLPGADVDWRADAGERQAYLDRLWAFARRLSPAHNDLKAHILNHRLVHDLGQGAPSRERLMEFLKLPRHSPVVNDEWLKTVRGSEIINSQNDLLTVLGSRGDEEPLVRAYLQHFFATDNNWESFSPYIKPGYLRRLFAETQILAGKGDMERWYSLIDDPTYYEALESRVELEFPAAQTTDFAVGEPVSLDVDVKNVGTLLVKVFEIDALAYALAEGREVDASIDLDGLVAGSENTYTYEDSALRRVRRHFEFPELTATGVYVVDFIGGGISSRAVIRKGHLEVRERLGSAGHAFEVVNRAGELHSDAAIYFGGQRYEAGASGEILLPYSTESGSKSLVVTAGGWVAVRQFTHLEESYALKAGFYVDRESLLPGQSAKLLVNPTLEVHGRRASLDLLEQVTLHMSATTLDGTTTALDVRDVELREGGEWVHEFRVPEGLARLNVKLSAEVPVLSTGKHVSLSSGTDSFRANAIDGSSQVDCPILGQDANGYFLDLLGKNGEPKPNHILSLTLRHRDYRDALTFSLKTGADGRLRLGHLDGIESLESSGLPRDYRRWNLSSDRQTFRPQLHGRVGQTLRVPYMGSKQTLGPADLSLLELRGRTPVFDRSRHATLVDGFVCLSKLEAGDYDLYLKETETRIRIRIVAGAQRRGWSVGSGRALEMQGEPLHVTSAQVEGDELVVRVKGADPHTRLHVTSSRFSPAYEAFTSLLPPGPSAIRSQTIRPARSEFHSGRQIGDEYRYILERRYAKTYPGNMLMRPGLLLNPWALHDTNSSIGLGGGAGGKFGGRSGGRKNVSAAGGGGRPQEEAQAPGVFANFGFMAEASTLLSNLRPDADGVLRIPTSLLGNGGFVRVVALNERSMAQRTVLREGRSLNARDLRLVDGLDPTEHFTQQRRIEFLAENEEITLTDQAGTDMESYETLADIFGLFRTLRPDSELGQFAFLLDWPGMDDDAKSEAYSEHACHELHVFLHRKDPAFFDRVVRPFLANKADKTFLDLWLLEEDLTAFLDPWAFSRLNTLEQVLLARRVEGIGGNVARLIRDQVALSPPSPAELDRLYSSSLRGSALRRYADGKDLGLAFRYKRRADGPTAPSGGGGGGGAYRGPTSPGAPAPSTERLELLDEELEAETGADDFFLGRRQLAQDKDARGRVQHLFTGIGATEQFVEHNYWHHHEASKGKAPIGANGFWLDLAETPPGGPFHSVHFAQATGNMAEMLMALALLDLPFESGEHSTRREGNRVTIQAASPLLLVTKELARVDSDTATTGLLVGQQFYPLSEGPDSAGDLSFVRGVAYGCRVVVTNPSPKSVSLEILLQIPNGALPVAGGQETRGTSLELAAYATQTVEYAFYFPQAGEFTHYPAHASSAGQYLAHAAPQSMTVLAAPAELDTQSWDHMSQRADLQSLLDHMGESNLLKVRLSQLAWRMKDRGSFDAIVGLLRERHLFDSTLWSYGLHHGDVLTTQEFLRQANHFVNGCGPWLTSELLDIDPIERFSYERVEYRPLINARAHPMGADREILNNDFARQYLALMNILCHKPQLDDTDWMSVTYQLLLQDRVEEALASFAKVDPSELPMRIQYDYMRAYLDFFSDDHAVAGGIAKAYSDHPLPHWRSRFQQIEQHLAEANGERAVGAGEEGTDAGVPDNDALAGTEPTLELKVEAGQVALEHRFLSSCELRYYVMDVEFLFSTSPFVQQGSGAFGYVKANRLDTIALPEENGRLVVDLPSELRSSNVLVEARAGGIVRRQAYYANTLRVQMIESYGQLKVTAADTGKPLPKAYVKVYVLDSGNVRFHKDGYTDLRGRFDYVSVSAMRSHGIERYAILVLDEEHGAVIREVQPPVK